MTLDMWTPHGPMVCFGKRAGSVDQGVYLTSTQDADHSTCAGWAQRRGVGSNAQVALLIASPPRRNGAALDRSAHRPATAVASTRDTGTIHSWDPPMVGVGEGAVVPRPRQPCRPRAAPGPPGSSSPPSLHVLFAPMEHARPSPRCYVVVHPHVRSLGVDTPCPPVTGRCARRPRYRRVGVPRGACPGAQAGPGGRRAPLLCRIGRGP